VRTFPASPLAEARGTKDLKNDMETKVVLSYSSKYSHFRKMFGFFWRRGWSCHWYAHLFSLQGCFCY